MKFVIQLNQNEIGCRGTGSWSTSVTFYLFKWFLFLFDCFQNMGGVCTGGDDELKEPEGVREQEKAEEPPKADKTEEPQPEDDKKSEEVAADETEKPDEVVENMAAPKEEVAEPAEEDEKKDIAEPVSSSAKPSVFFILGGPGAGKGTQCANLVNEFGLVHLSAGDLLRAERNSGSDDAELINNYIKEGKIVPVEITVGLIKKAMEKNMGLGRDQFLIDGFPRNADNLEGWNKIMADFAEVPFLLLLECTEEEMTKRILKRAETAEVARKDDNLETLKKRFKVFQDDTMPVVNQFKEQGKCRMVESIGTIESIYGNIRKHFIQSLIKPKVVFVLGGPGAGKGTQCTTLVEDEQFKSAFAHLSAGDLLRAERNSGSADAELINNYIKEGKIVPVEITVGLIKNAMNKLMAEEGKYVFIIDGFPRNQDNLEGWNKV